MIVQYMHIVHHLQFSLMKVILTHVPVYPTCPPVLIDEIEFTDKSEYRVQLNMYKNSGLLQIR